MEWSVILPFKLVLVTMVALLIDRMLGEPRRHPLVWFGRCASVIEKRLNDRQSVMRGAIAAIIVIAPPLFALVLIQKSLQDSYIFSMIIEIYILYFVIGWQSLKQHADAVYQPLVNNDLVAARAALSMIVSRQTIAMESPQIVGSSVESLLENGHDSLFASLFWYALLGPVGALLHRLVNTLDAMWGYKSERYAAFGKFAARADDVLGWIPARLTALSYAVVGSTKNALASWRSQAKGHPSPNGGVVMAAGAGALNRRIGGPQVYEAKTVDKPWLGCGETAGVEAIPDSYRLIERSVLLWLFGFFCVGLFGVIFSR